MDKKSFHKVCSAPAGSAIWSLTCDQNQRLIRSLWPLGWQTTPSTLLDRRQVEQVFGLGKRWLELAAHRGVGPSMITHSPDAWCGIEHATLTRGLHHGVSIPPVAAKKSLAKWEPPIGLMIQLQTGEDTA